MGAADHSKLAKILSESVRDAIKPVFQDFSDKIDSDARQRDQERLDAQKAARMKTALKLGAQIRALKKAKRKKIVEIENKAFGKSIFKKMVFTLGLLGATSLLIFGPPSCTKKEEPTNVSMKETSIKSTIERAKLEVAERKQVQEKFKDFIVGKLSIDSAEGEIRLYSCSDEISDMRDPDAKSRGEVFLTRLKPFDDTSWYDKGADDVKEGEVTKQYSINRLYVVGPNASSGSNGQSSHYAIVPLTDANGKGGDPDYCWTRIESKKFIPERQRELKANDKYYKASKDDPMP